MPRDERAYLSDIPESCEAIMTAVRGLDMAAYQSTRLVAHQSNGNSLSSATRPRRAGYIRGDHSCAANRGFQKPVDARVPNRG
jgi:hypothetical protein